MTATPQRPDAMEHTPQQEALARGPLAGVRILDLSTVIAGPWASALLSDYGAEVVKVEIPGRGDPMRDLPPHKEGKPLWWKVTNRNKQGITLDLRTAEGREILGRLLPRFDVVVENFRPGTLDHWGITREWLQAIHPRLTILRVTGFGQTGPYRRKPGFARVFEAMSGFTHLCGEADGPPLHIGFPIADAVAGLFGALGVVSALYELAANGTQEGQEIDCSLMESMLRVLEFLPIEYDQLGIVRGRTGSASQYGAPGNVYRTRDDRWASIAASTQRIFERFCDALGRRDLVADPRFSSNASRVANREALDEIIGREIGQRTLAELRTLLDAHQVGFSPIYDIRDVFQDEHVRARRAIIPVDDPDFGTVMMQAVTPQFSRTPGRVLRSGPALGEHNAKVLGEVGLGPSAIEDLARRGIV